MINTASVGVSAASAGSYLLCLGRDELNAHDLTRYNADLQQMAHELFVQDAAACRTELRVYARNRSGSLGQGDAGDKESVLGSWSQPLTFNTAEGLKQALDVSLAFDPPNLCIRPAFSKSR